MAFVANAPRKRPGKNNNHIRLIMTSGDIILLGHGSGGQMTHDLIDKIILPILQSGSAPTIQEDAALINIPQGKTFFTTDSYVVDPFIFPGGDIGDLAVNGTINDLAMQGAMPVALSLGLILEEGLLIEDFKVVLRSISKAAKDAKAPIVCGDTKVVPRGRGDKIFINTSGVGVAAGTTEISGANAKAGDKVLLSGTIGDHGIAIMSQREGLEFDTVIESDTAALHLMVAGLIGANVEIHSMRDPTRGGLATTMVELAQSSRISIRLDERSIPISGAVAGACEILGLDPMHIANEGKMIAIIKSEDAIRALEIIARHPRGKDAAIIGEVTGGPPGKVTMTSLVGGSRIINKMPGELLPRIC
ncbi:[NiFe] hydrogenase metallocenter assembly protein HypE [hydrothermal vent metagenome]|uniref:[NiFe] hydrogenase metallocenter assembly protein HypE n=1 Tax=hydrothermal vent metagenome TaxID=652676 RepID=A0A3B1DAC3_9ZZZZ